MFEVKLYNFSKKENSTKRPSGAPVVTKSCRTNAPLDTLAPVVPLNLSAAYNPSAHNYIHVAALGRYYWITNWTWADGLWYAHCEVDPLASFKNEIIASTCYVLRSAQDYDGSITDTTYPATSVVNQTSQSVTSPWDNTGSYVVAIISQQGATNYYAMTPSMFRTFGNTVFSSDWLDREVGEALELGLAKAFVNPMQYVNSVMWIPIDLTSTEHAEEIYLGWWDSGTTGWKLDVQNARVSGNVTFTIPKHPQAATRGAYLNMAPYSEYTLDVRPWGRIAIDPSTLQGATTLYAKYTLDLVSGVGIFETASDTNYTLRTSLSVAKVGVPVQFSQVMLDFTGMVVNTVSAATQIASENYVGAAASIGSALHSAFPQISTQGIDGGRAGVVGSTWQLNAKFFQIADEDLDHRGRPLCQNRLLSTLSGYVQVADADITLSCTASEARAIRAYMEGGFFIE